MFEPNTKDLEAFSKEALGPLENKLHEFNKKAAGAGWNFFKQSLATASEPFFRKAMGERYFDRFGFGGGMGLWAGGTIAAYYLPQWRSLVSLLCDWKGYGDMAATFRNTTIVVTVGGVMCVLHWIWGMQSMRLMAKYRAEEVAYHTRSRGTPRWGDHQFAAGLLIVCLLLMFNLPVAVLFIAALIANSNIRAEQQAAIMSRYWDAMDRELENQHLEDAALGQCPTEKTFLDKPISKDFKPEMRENIAAAMVGKPVSIVARAPKSKKPAGQKQPPPAEPPQEPEPDQEPSPEPAQKKTESPTVAEEPAPQPEEIKSQFDPSQEFNPKAAARQLWESNPEKFLRLARFGILLRRCLIALVALGLIAAAAYGAVHLIQSHRQPQPTAKADPQPAAPQQAEPTPPNQPPTTAPPAQSPQAPLVVKKETPPPTAPLAQPSQAPLVAQKDTPPPITEPTPPLPQKLSTNELAAQKAALNKFVNYGWNEMTSISSRIEKLPNFSDRQRIFRAFHPIQGTVGQLVAAQQKSLNGLTSDTLAEEATKLFQEMLKARDSITNSYRGIEAAIDQAPK